MKLLFDLFPVILFFAVYQVAGILPATAVAIASTVVQIAWLKISRRPVETMQWTSLGIIVVFGGLTLFLQDEIFIKWKPTVLYALFAAALLGARLATGRNLIRTMMGKQLTLPDPIWERLNIAWVVFFAVLGVLNLWVAYTFSTDAWVNFKLFGAMGLTFAFVIAQALYVGRYVQDEA
ncbi:MAG TPA: septation protein A [Burkholderiaceae bacterium]|jgi:intracellular septation protein|nr:septation protein A [Burkholderiaceae bacterium]